MAGGWIVQRHELAHLAVALKALPENKTKSLEDLALEACRFLLYCQNVLEDVDSNPSKWHLPQNREALKKLSKPETARLVTGQKRRDRAVAWFDRFHAFLSHSNEILDESTRKDRVPLWDDYEKSGSWPEWYLDWLKAVFAQWRKYEESRLQSERKKI
jgi:hypothetical protein